MIPVSGSVEGSARGEVIHLATNNVRFSRILVGTDFSRLAAQALKMAITIGEIFGSELYLVHSPSPCVYGPGTHPASPEFLSANLDSAKEQMEQLAAREPRLRGLQVKTIVAYAGAVELIEQVATDEKIDLIIVGSHGPSGLKRLALGSVAETVLRKATCPVLIVGPNCHSEQHPFRSILFATDFESTGLRPAQYAAALAERANGRFTLLHVIEKHLPVPGLDAEFLENSLKVELERLVPADAEFSCKPKVRIEYGVPGQVVPGVAMSELASMVVVGSRDRSALADHAPWSTLSHIIRKAPCGVLVVRSHLL
jgi:nucleotide-binding universal stress UspA family protein